TFDSPSKEPEIKTLQESSIQKTIEKQMESTPSIQSNQLDESIQPTQQSTKLSIESIKPPTESIKHPTESTIPTQTNETIQESTHLVESIESTQPTESIQSTQLAESIEPTQSIESIEPTQSTEHTEPKE